MKLETIYISRTKKLSDLKNKLISLKKDQFTLTETDQSQSLRLWKLNTQASLEQFKKVFSEKSKDIRESQTQFKCGDLLYLEYNGDCQLEELELADTDITVIEHSTETSPWIFEVKKMEQKEGTNKKNNIHS